MSEHSIWTIGHSTRSFSDFLAILEDANIQQVVDVRSMPGSNKFPQFNKERLSVSLENQGIDYVHMAILGGRRRAQPDSDNTIWRNKSFRAYADYMETADFETGLQRLMQRAQSKHTAIMCAEAVWWRCHRSMIADALKARGWTVLHLMGKHQVKTHPYTQPASIVNGKLTYASDT